MYNIEYASPFSTTQIVFLSKYKLRISSEQELSHFTIFSLNRCCKL